MKKPEVKNLVTLSLKLKVRQIFATDKMPSTIGVLLILVAGEVHIGEPSVVGVNDTDGKKSKH
jgi:hypothetical protein